MLSRVKQLYRYLFLKFDRKNEEEIKYILSEEEFKIFSEMSEYDRLHSFLVYESVKENIELQRDMRYLKLALLHDIGKGKVGIFRRIKKVLIGDKELEKHPEVAYKKLKSLDIEVSLLCKQHHDKIVDEKMKIFQEIDDR